MKNTSSNKLKITNLKAWVEEKRQTNPRNFKSKRFGDTTPDTALPINRQAMSDKTTNEKLGLWGVGEYPTLSKKEKREADKFLKDMGFDLELMKVSRGIEKLNDKAQHNTL